MVSFALNRLAPIDFTRYIDRLTERFTGRNGFTMFAPPL